MSWVEVDKYRLKNFLRDFQPFPLWFWAIHATGSSDDTFNTFIAEDVGIVSVIDVEAMEVADVCLHCFRQRLFGDCSDKVSKCFEGDMEGRGKSMMSREFDVGSLSCAIDFVSIGSESMPKKVCSFVRNVNIDLPLVRCRWKLECSFWGENCGNTSAILWISKWERASAIQLSFDDSHCEETSMS